jgi:hypothetical protein
LGNPAYAVKIRSNAGAPWWIRVGGALTASNPISIFLFCVLISSCHEKCLFSLFSATRFAGQERYRQQRDR